MLNKKTLTVMFSLALAGSMAVPTFAAAALPAQSSSVDWKPALSQSVSTHAASQPLTAGETYLTRGELILALYEAEGKPVVNFAMDYSDVASDAPYAEAIRWASSEGIASGYDDGRFGPDDGVTREQMAVILYQYEQSNGQGFTGAWAFPLDYADADGISEYAYEAVCWVTMKGIMGDVGDNRFAPNDPVTQSEADLLFQGYFDKPQSTELANPFVSCQTMSDAAQVAGFSMELPSFLSPSSIRAVEGSMIEVLSERDYGQIMLRKGLGTEDTLIQYLKTAPHFEGAAHEKAWLLRVAGNLSKNRIAYNTVRSTDELNESLVAQQREDLSFVWQAVKDLPVKYREVIHLFYYEGLSTGQIAAILEQNESTVRSHLKRGQEKLKLILKEGYDFE